MTTFEIDVDIHVRRTLHISGPSQASAAVALVEAMLRADPKSIGMLTKWVYDQHMVPRPMEQIIGNDIVIGEVRENPEPPHAG